MKKMILMLFTIIIAVVTIICVKYSAYITEYNSVLKENIEFEEYTKKEIYGSEVGTLINKAIDKNIRNNIEKDTKGLFITNDKNSIKIEIYIQDSGQTYQMETIYNKGMKQFIQHYSDIKFKCSNIEYHKTTGKIKYLLFEQIITS